MSRLRESEFPHTLNTETTATKPKLMNRQSSISSTMSDLVQQVIVAIKDQPSRKSLSSTHSRRTSTASTSLVHITSADSAVEQRKEPSQPNHNQGSQSQQDDIVIYDDPESRIAKRRILHGIDNEEESSKRVKAAHESQTNEMMRNSTPALSQAGSRPAIADASQKTQRTIGSDSINKAQSNTPRLSTGAIKRSRVRRFLLSSMSPEEKSRSMEIIRKLGGAVYDCVEWRNDCTHLIVGKLNRNEKVLSAICSGKW